MRARINHGNKGKSIDTLLNRYDDCMIHPVDYYDYIESSYVNGNFDQCIELFNEMKHEQQITFLVEYAEVSKDFIIRNL